MRACLRTTSLYMGFYVQLTEEAFHTADEVEERSSGVDWALSDNYGFAVRRSIRKYDAFMEDYVHEMVVGAYEDDPYETLYCVAMAQLITLGIARLSVHLAL